MNNAHRFFFIAALALPLLGLGCKDEGAKGDKPADAKSGAAASTGDKPEAKKADKPAAKDVPCDKVVDKIASLNEGSGDAEKKLWNKMCDEMTPEQRSCAVGISDMAGLKGCMGKKGDEKLKKE